MSVIKLKLKVSAICSNRTHSNFTHHEFGAIFSRLNFKLNFHREPDKVYPNSFNKVLCHNISGDTLPLDQEHCNYFMSNIKLKEMLYALVTTHCFGGNVSYNDQISTFVCVK